MYLVTKVQDWRQPCIGYLIDYSPPTDKKEVVAIKRKVTWYIYIINFFDEGLEEVHQG